MAQDVAQDMAQDMAQDLAFRGSSPRHHHHRRCLCAAGDVLRWGATGQLSGVWLVLWEGTSKGAAQSASMFVPKW